MSIATVTLNPAIDETVTLDKLTAGTVHRARTASLNAGGKGINVASCLADWGAPVTVTGVLGADNANIFEVLFQSKAIEDRFVRVPGRTRNNIKIVDSQVTTDINLPGLTIPADLMARVETIISGFRGIVVLSGSLPEDCPADFYARLTTRLVQAGSKVVVDTSGEPLAKVLSAPVLPFCIKPNLKELAEWAGKSLDNPEAVVEEVKKLRRRGVGLVVVSMGESGALFASQEGAVIAKLPATGVTSTVGAGDAMVAGIVAALDERASLERIARLSTAFAVAKLGFSGAHLPKKAEIEKLASEVLVIDVKK